VGAVGKRTAALIVLLRDRCPACSARQYPTHARANALNLSGETRAKRKRPARRRV